MNDNEKYQNKYRIPPARATWHDYNGGAYFITVCTKSRECSFGEIVTQLDEPTMQFTSIGQCLVETLYATSLHNKYAQIPLFAVMPNHWHAIVLIDEERGKGKDVTCYVSISDVTSDVTWHDGYLNRTKETMIIP